MREESALYEQEIIFDGGFEPLYEDGICVDNEVLFDIEDIGTPDWGTENQRGEDENNEKLFEKAKHEVENTAARVEYHLINFIYRAERDASAEVLDGILKNICRAFDEFDDAITNAEKIARKIDGSRRLSNCIAQNAMENLLDLLKTFKHIEQGKNKQKILKISKAIENSCLPALSAFFVFSISEAVWERNRKRIENHFLDSELGIMFRGMICR